jgi:hypothetical protein
MSQVLLLAFVLAGQVGPEHQHEPAPLAVQVGLFAYGPDGAIIGSATTGAEAGSFEGSAFTVPTCGFGTSSQVPSQATYAWEIKGEVIERRGADAVVQIGWTRTRQDGRLTSAAGSRHVIVRKDIPVALDEMMPSKMDRCHIARLSLEVRLTPRSTSGGGGRGLGRRGGSADTKALGGGGSGSVNDANSAVARSPVGAGGASRLSEPAFDVELWLVHENSSMKERTVPLRVQMPSIGDAFTFPSVTLTTPRGEVTVNVGGRIGFKKDADLQSAVLVSITRTLRLMLAQPAPIREVANTGSTEISHPMPGPDDVVAFKMPAIRFPDVGLELPDALSVRLRVRPTR